MKVTIEVPRVFEIELSQIRNYLIDQNWKQWRYNDEIDEYSSPKYKNAYARVPTTDQLYDIEYCICTLLRFIANVEDVDIETLITKITNKDAQTHPIPE